MARLIYLTILSWLLVWTATAQTPRVDSIRHTLLLAKNDKDRLDRTLSLCREIYSLHGDTLCAYALKARELATTLNDHEKIIRANTYLVFGLSCTGKLDESVSLADENIKAIKENNYPGKLLAQNYIFKSLSCYKTNKPKEIMRMMYELIRNNEQDTLMLMSAKVYIAMAYSVMGQYRESLSWFWQAIHLSHKDAQSIEEKEMLARAYMCCAISYIHIYEASGNKADADSSLTLTKKAEKISRENQILFFYCQSQTLLGYYYIYFQKSRQAEDYLLNAMKIRQIIGDPAYMASDMQVLGTYYATTGQTAKGIDICKKALQLIDNYNLTPHLRILVYNSLAQNYYAAKDYRNYAETLKHILATKDSAYYATAGEEISMLQTVHDLQKKELTVKQQQIDLQNKNYLVAGIVLLLLFASVLAWVRFKGYKKNQQMRLEFMQREEERRIAESIKEAEDKERQRIAADLHDNLGVQVNSILHLSEQLKVDHVAEPDTLAVTLNDTAKEMLFFLRETLWALKSTDTNSANLWLRILNFTSQMKRHYSHIQFIVSGGGREEFNLPPAKALNILMIIQEAIHNAIKHSEGDKITIAGNPVNDTWHLTIHDNGKGFIMDSMQEKENSYGFINMQQRAASSHIQLSIKSDTGKGTMVSMVI